MCTATASQISVATHDETELVSDFCETAKRVLASAEPGSRRVGLDVCAFEVTVLAHVGDRTGKALVTRTVSTAVERK